MAPTYVSLLFLGLNENSRVWRLLNHVKVPLNIQLQAMMVDCLSILVWQNSEDGQKGKNKPKMITPILLGKGDNKNENTQVFMTSAEFRKERERRIKRLK